MGERIENGKRTHAVRGVTIAGNLLDLFKNVEAAGSDLIFSGSAPMQPVTMTRPFCASAAPIASSDSVCALSRKPQVLTMTRSAPACSRASA